MTGFATMPPPPGVLRSWIELYEPLTEAPAQAHLGAAIALISAAIGWKASVRWGENEEPCTVNVVLEGRSATARKTTVAGGAHSLAREAMQPIHEDARQLRTRQISHTSSRGLIEAVAAKDKTEAERWEREPPPGVLLVWDEFGSVLGDPRDIKGAGWLGQIRAMLMQFTSGRHGGIQTGAEKLAPARCAVSVLATMTRVELEQRVNYGLLRDGFMGRFLLIPFEGRTRLLATPPPWTGPMMRQRDDLVAWLRKLATADVPLGDIFKRMTPEATELREEWYRTRVGELEQQATDDESEGSLAAVEAFGRLQTAALKVAVVAAVSEWDPDTSDLSEVTIDVEHINYGQALAEICLREIIELGRLAGHPLRDVYADKVKQYLTKHGPTTKKVLLDGVRIQSLARGDRWRVIEDLHPDTLEIAKIGTGGRPGLLVTLVADPDERPRNPSADTYADTESPGQNGSTMRKNGVTPPYAAFANEGPPPPPTTDASSRPHDPPEKTQSDRVSVSSVSVNHAVDDPTYADDTRTKQGASADIYEPFEVDDDDDL